MQRAKQPQKLQPFRLKRAFTTPLRKKPDRREENQAHLAPKWQAGYALLLQEACSLIVLLEREVAMP
jgi:hypothetical protein